MKERGQGDTPSEFMSAADVASTFGVTTETVRNWIIAKRFPGAFRPGGTGQWRIPRAEVVALAQHNFGGNDDG